MARAYRLHWTVDDSQFVAVHEYCAQHKLKLSLARHESRDQPWRLTVTSQIKCATPKEAVRKALGDTQELALNGVRVWRTKVESDIHDYEPVPKALLQVFQYYDFHFTLPVPDMSYWQLQRNSAHLGVKWSLSVQPEGSGFFPTATLRSDKRDVASLWDRKHQFMECVRQLNGDTTPFKSHHGLCIYDNNVKMDH